MTSDQNFQNIWVNGKQPQVLDEECKERDPGNEVGKPPLVLHMNSPESKLRLFQVSFAICVRYFRVWRDMDSVRKKFRVEHFVCYVETVHGKLWARHTTHSFSHSKVASRIVFRAKRTSYKMPFVCEAIFGPILHAVRKNE